jgi:integrase/recombinase XerD
VIVIPEQEIEDYLQWKTSKRDISPTWEKNTRSLLVRFSSMVKKPIQTCSTKDILTAFKTIRESKAFKPNYKRQLVHVGKSLCMWASKTNKNIDFAEIESVKLPEHQWKTKTPDEMLTVDEIVTTIQSARTSRDKALIAMLYDGSNRPIELLRLVWRDIIADEHGYYFITDAKTRKERHIRLTNQSIPYLDQWRAEHPDPSPDQYVFCTINATGKGIRPLTIDNVQRMIKLLRRNTGILKLKASIFRPSKITHDVASGVELPYIMKKNWGSLRTKMIDVYTNLDAGYMDEVALRNAGMERRIDLKEKKQYKLEPPICPICHKVNLLGSKYCSDCMHPLTEEAKMKVQNTSQQLQTLFIENPKAQVIFQELLAQLKN